MNEVAWIPPGMTMPNEFIAAFVPPGKVTERIWIQALTDRVEKMIKAEPDPKEAALWATKVAGQTLSDEPWGAAEILVLHNLELQTLFSLAVIDKDPFEEIVSEPDLEAAEIINETDLEMWIDLLLAETSVSSLD